MKKKILFFSAYLILSAAIFAQDIDDLIELVRVNGYQNEYGKFEKESLGVEKEKIDRTNRDGISLDIDSEHKDYRDSDEDSSETTAELKYDFLILDATYDNLDGDSSAAVGVEKDLKDLIYSEKSHEMKNFIYEQEQRLNEVSENMDNEIIELIELYREYKDAELQIEFEKSLIPSLLAELETVEKKYELGTGTEFDYKYALMSLENQKNDISNLEDEIEKLRKSFYLKYRLEVKSGYLEDFDGEIELDQESFAHIGERDMENLDLDEKISQENLKYSKYENKMPSIELGTQYELEDEYWTVYLSLSKNIFEYDDDSKLEEINLQELALKKKELEKNTEDDRASYWDEYKTLKKELENLEREFEVKELEYRIDKKKYDIGTKDFIDYRETYDEYRELNVEYINKKNELYAFIEKLKYRR